MSAAEKARKPRTRAAKATEPGNENATQEQAEAAESGVVVAETQPTEEARSPEAPEGSAELPPPYVAPAPPDGLLFDIGNEPKPAASDPEQPGTEPAAGERAKARRGRRPGGKNAAAEPTKAVVTVKKNKYPEPSPESIAEAQLFIEGLVIEPSVMMLDFEPPSDVRMKSMSRLGAIIGEKYLGDDILPEVKFAALLVLWFITNWMFAEKKKHDAKRNNSHLRTQEDGKNPFDAPTSGRLS